MESSDSVPAFHLGAHLPLSAYNTPSIASINTSAKNSALTHGDAILMPHGARMTFDAINHLLLFTSSVPVNTPSPGETA